MSNSTIAHFSPSKVHGFARPAPIAPAPAAPTPTGLSQAELRRIVLDLLG